MKLGRWFQDSEFLCRCGRIECEAPKTPAPALVALLDRLREAVSAPLIITSGLRCSMWNAHLGGEPLSGHLTGTEADLSCPSSRFRYRLLVAACALGVRRLGLYPKHVHVGLDTTALPLDVVWLGAVKEGL